MLKYYNKFISRSYYFYGKMMNKRLMKVCYSYIKFKFIFLILYKKLVICL